MKYTITISQRKGGVGKSTATLNLGYALAETGQKVLIIDLDDQQNTTTSISQTIESRGTVSDLLLKDEVQTDDVVIPTEWENVWMIPASPNLSGAVKHLASEVGGHLVLKEKLDACRDYDICLIDNSPSLNILNINSLCASTHLFMPLSSKYFSLQGLSQTLAAFRKVKNRLNAGLQLLGMAFVIHDGRNTLANEVKEKVCQQYPSLVFNATVGINIKIEEAQVSRQSILTYAPADRGADQYRELAAEVLCRLSRVREPEAAGLETNHG